ncbi:MAG: hypothetical protein HDP28_00960 [Clostridia bacterium]|nr:hypothetical protein [Clostridia bacterium]
MIVFEKIEKVQRFYFQLLTKIEVEPFKLQLLDSTIVCYTASANKAGEDNPTQPTKLIPTPLYHNQKQTNPKPNNLKNSRNQRSNPNTISPL